MDGFEDTDGCPDPDNDGDGICDPWVTEKKQADTYKATCRLTDKCPTIREDADNFEDEDGCPDPDNDKDQICDPWVAEKKQADTYKSTCRLTDKCPLEPETVNGDDDDDGCPERAKVEGKKIIILDRVLFFFDKTEIKPESFPVLQDVAKILKENPQIAKVRIEGHTDLKGKAAYNKKLSTGRAQAVMDFLVKEGIDPARLLFAGYGMEKPLVKVEKTDEDAQQNRRVEFIILEVTDKVGPKVEIHNKSTDEQPKPPVTPQPPVNPQPKPPVTPPTPPANPAQPPVVPE